MSFENICNRDYCFSMTNTFILVNFWGKDNDAHLAGVEINAVFYVKKSSIFSFDQHSSLLKLLVSVYTGNGDMKTTIVNQNFYHII